jgi:nucleotide-binding universal stress UspA family protein
MLNQEFYYKSLIAEHFHSIIGREMINNILVAIDGSAQANRALDFAMDLAQKYSAEVMLLVVVPPVFLPISSLSVMKSQAIADASAELESSFRAVISKAKEKTKKLTTLNVSTKFEHGNPDEVIIETAELGKFDVLVMGSRGYRGYALGSVSSRVVENATCPVLIVK